MSARLVWIASCEVCETTNDPGKLLVAVAGYGMFGFTVRADNILHHAYLAEKLGFRPSVTTEALAELVNSVMVELVSAVTA